MEKQKMNVATLVIVIAIVLIVGVIIGAFIGKNISKIQLGKDNEAVRIQQENKIIKNEVTEANLQDNKDYASSKQDEKFIAPSFFTSNSKKIFDKEYFLNIFDAGSVIRITVENGVPKVKKNKINNEIAEYGFDVSKIKLSDEMQEIKGINQKVADVCIVSERQVAGSHIIFLMENGTIEHSTLQNMLDNVSSQGKVEGLDNIVSLQKINLGAQNTTNTAVAIDENNNCYDVLKCLSESKLSSEEKVNKNLEDFAWVLRDIECEIGQLPSNENILANLENKYYLAWSAMNHDTNERSKFQGINANGEAETGARAVKTEEFIKYYQKIYQEDLDIEQLLRTKVGDKLTIKNGMMYSHIITGYSQDIFKIEVEDIQLNEKDNVYTLRANCLRNTNSENKKIKIQYQKDTNSQTNILKSISFIQ